MEERQLGMDTEVRYGDGWYAEIGRELISATVTSPIAYGQDAERRVARSFFTWPVISGQWSVVCGGWPQRRALRGGSGGAGSIGFSQRKYSIGGGCVVHKVGRIRKRIEAAPIE